MRRQRGARAWSLVALASLICGLSVSPAAARPVAAQRAQKLDLNLRQRLGTMAPSTTLNAIVTVRVGSKVAVREALVAAGATITSDFSIIEALGVRLSASALLAVADDARVVAISTDATVETDSVTSSVSGTAANATFTLRRALGIDGPTTTSPLTGNGVTVAVIDSGIYKAPDFGKRVVGFKDYTDVSASSSTDGYGHGTHVAGIIGGASTEAPGIAKNARLISLRVLNGYGAGSTSSVISALQWVRDNKAAYGIDVVNMSLGHPIYEPAATDPLVQAVEATVRAGVVVVASAGNIGMNPLTGQVGYAGITSPGNAPSAITVGALRTYNTTRRTDDIIAEYSSRGPTWYDAFAKPDVVAPGHKVLATSYASSLLYQAFPTLQYPVKGKTFMYLSGTSMASATVTGTVALMIEGSRTRFGGVKPKPNAIKAMLQHSASSMGDVTGVRYDVLTQGAGAVTGGALTLAQSIDPRKAKGTMWLVTGVTEASPVDGQSLSWAQNLVWGNNLVWGDAVYTNITAWSDNIVWGDSDNIVWGDSLSALSFDDNIVWGDNVIWGDNIVWGDSYNVVGMSDDNIVWGDVAQSALGSLSVYLTNDSSGSTSSGTSSKTMDSLSSSSSSGGGGTILSNGDAVIADPLGVLTSLAD